MKRIFSLLLAIGVCFTILPTAFAVDYGVENVSGDKVYEQTFDDVPVNHWAFLYIEELVERGAINGFPDGNFYPNETVSRGQFAKIMVTAAGLTAAPASRSSFADVPLTHWASPFVETAKSYMTAYQNSAGQMLFKPDEAAVREDIAVAVVMLKGYDTRLADISLLDVMFSDAYSISAAAKPYVALAVENGIISGYPGTNGEKGTFGGQRTITRGEAAAMLWRAFQYGDDNKVIPGEEEGSTVKPGDSQNPVTPPADQYTVETLESLPNRMDDYIITKTGQAYYLQENRLYHIADGKTEQLFDGNTDYYKEVTALDFVKRLLEGPEENYGNGNFEFLDESDLLYFDRMHLLQLTYDAVNDRVYVVGITNQQSMALLDFYTVQIYQAEDMNAPVAEIPYGTYTTGVGWIPWIQCAGDTLLYTTYPDTGYNHYEDNNAKIVNVSTGGLSYFCDNFEETCTHLQVNGEIIRWWRSYVWRGSAQRFVLSSGSWETINIVADNLNDDTIFCTDQNQIFYAAKDGIYRLDEAGTNRLKGEVFLSWEDLNIQDGKSIGEIGQFLFDDSGDIIFADLTHQVVRRINV